MPSRLRVLFFFIFTALVGRAEQIDEIRIPDDIRTRRSVIEHTMRLKLPQEMSKAQIKKAVQRLKNVSQISEVRYKILNEGDKRILSLAIEEKWTLLPYAKGNLESGAKNFSLGLTEANLFGYFLETGVIYDNVDGRSGGTVFMEVPQLYGMPLKVEFKVSRSLVENAVFDSGGNKFGAYTTSTDKIKLGGEWSFSDMVRVGASMEYQALSLSTGRLKAADVTLNQTNGFNPGQQDDRLNPSLYVGVGEVDTLNIVQQSGLRMENNVIFPLSFHDSFLGPRVETSMHIFKPWRWHSMFAGRLKMVRNFARGIYETLDSASLAGLRGYEGSKFQGQEMYGGNVEFRIPSLEYKWATVQHVLFVDGLVSRYPYFPFHSQTQRAVGTGVGLRVFFPKLYKVMIRVDYVVAGDPNPSQPLSISMNQFF